MVEYTYVVTFGKTYIFNTKKELFNFINEYLPHSESKNIQISRQRWGSKAMIHIAEIVRIQNQR